MVPVQNWNIRGDHDATDDEIHSLPLLDEDRWA